MKLQTIHPSTPKQADPQPSLPLARCPHGGAPGACPLCSGAGGGGGGATKRGAGLMGWNEAYALWKSIQVAQARNTDYLKASAGNQNRLQNEAFSLSLRQMATALLLRFLQGTAPALMLLNRAITSPIKTLANTANAFIQTINRPVQMLAARLIDISDKLATILGDARKLLDDIRQHNIENLKSLLARFAWIGQLAKIQNLVGKVLRQFATGQIFRSVARRLKSVLGGLKRFFTASDSE